MEKNTFNLEEYKVMKNYCFDTDEQYINEYYSKDINEFNNVQNLRCNNTTSNFLKIISDESKYTKYEIYENLRNCLYNKKSCVFSCGANVTEHKQHFNKLLDSAEYLTACWKSSCEHLNYKCDILGIGEHLNMYRDNYVLKSYDSYKILFLNKNFTYNVNIKPVMDITFMNNSDKHTSIINYNVDTIKIINNELFMSFYGNGNTYSLYSFIMVLKFMGIDEHYLFGFYLSNTTLDITNYSYEDLKIYDGGHHYDSTVNNNESNTYRYKEPGYFTELIQSYFLGLTCSKVFNVSRYGVLSNTIKRLSFNEIFVKNKKYLNIQNIHDDYVAQIDKYVDKEKYCKYHNIPYNHKCDLLYFHYAHNMFVNNKSQYFIPLNNDMKCEYTIKDSLMNNLDKKNNFINIPNDFNWETYTLIHKDLSCMNCFAAHLHYEISGFKEKRKYKFKNVPSDFNWERYVELNDELQNMDKRQATLHYENHGFKEGLVYK